MGASALIERSSVLLASNLNTLTLYRVAVTRGVVIGSLAGCSNAEWQEFEPRKWLAN